VNEQQLYAPDLSSFQTGMFIALIVMGAYFLYAYIKFKRAAVSVVAEQKIKKILQSHFAYYRGLSQSDQQEFVRRVCIFIDRKSFIPRMFRVVTPDMKVLIAASAVQLTFGLPEITLQYFKRIIIYPENYYSVISKRMHKGEVNPKAQAIVLSWKNFLKGYQIPDDSYNLGLHEMAHALELENMIENDEYDFLPKESWKAFSQEAAAVVQDIKSGEHQFLRAYAATNLKEFFAVAVENFFERPVAFKRELPRLYGILVLLLNQDPLNTVLYKSA